MKLGDIAKNSAGLDGEEHRLSEDQLIHLQKVLLGILDDIVDICSENNLTYILIGGTAIGALRHGGFIPWDDDIDIAVPREDFERFIEIVRKDYSDKYTILHPQDQNNYGRIIPKIRLKGTVYRTILERDLDDCGVFIDIYLIENAYDNKVLRTFQGITDLFFGLLLSCRRLYNGRAYYSKYYTGFSRDSLSFKIKKFIGFLASFATLNQWARWTDYWYSVCKNNLSDMVSIPSDDYHFFGELYYRKNLCMTKEVNFEGRKLTVPVIAEEYLKKRYGEYMKLPPVDKRERNCYLEYDLGEVGNESIVDRE